MSASEMTKALEKARAQSIAASERALQQPAVAPSALPQGVPAGFESFALPADMTDVDRQSYLNRLESQGYVPDPTGKVYYPGLDGAEIWIRDAEVGAKLRAKRQAEVAARLARITAKPKRNEHGALSRAELDELRTLRLEMRQQLGGNDGGETTDGNRVI